MTTSAHPDRRSGLRAINAAPSGRIVIVNVPMATYLMIDGSDPIDSPQFEVAVGALMEVSAELRMFVKDPGELFGPMPLELLWPNAEDAAWNEAVGEPAGWTAMTPQPRSVTPELLTVVRDRVPIRADLRSMRRIHLGSLREGLCAQTMVPGTLNGAPDLRRRFLAQIRLLGYEPIGAQHEIHLATLQPEGRLPIRTILRQPIRRTW